MAVAVAAADMLVGWLVDTAVLYCTLADLLICTITEVYLLYRSVTAIYDDYTHKLYIYNRFIFFVSSGTHETSYTDFFIMSI